MSTGRSKGARLVLAAVVAAAWGCRDNPQAPPPPPPPPALPSHVTVTLDTLSDGGDDIGDQWGTVTLLLAPDQTLHIVALDGWDGVLRNFVCSTGCAGRAQWAQGRGDSSSQFYGSSDGAGAVWTSGGIAAVYSGGTPSGALLLRLTRCAGACGPADAWVGANVMPAMLRLSTSLAADAAGGLHILFRLGGSLHYAHCAAACDSAAGWQDASIAPSPGTASLIALAPGGSVHVFYGTANGLYHTVCAANCSIASSWQSAAVPGAFFLGTIQAMTAAFTPDGRLHLAFTDGALQVTYGVCSAPCTAASAWAVRTLPLSARDVALAADARGRLYLATDYPSVAVSRCDTGCRAASDWQTVRVDSARGPGRVAIVVDTAGRAGVASAMANFPMILQYTQLEAWPAP